MATSTFGSSRKSRQAAASCARISVPSAFMRSGRFSRTTITPSAFSVSTNVISVRPVLRVFDLRGAPPGASPRDRRLLHADRAALLELGDLVGGETKLDQHLLGVAARDGRGGAERGRRARKAHRRADDRQRAVHRAHDGLRHLQVLHLRIGERLVDRVDRAGGDADVVQLLDELVHRHLAHLRVDRLAQRGAVFGLRPRGGGREARVLAELLRADHAEEVAEHPVAAGADVDDAVLGGEDAGREAGRVVVASLAGHLASDQPARRLEVEHRDLRLEQRGVHPLSLAGALTLEQRRHDALRQEHPGAEVVDGDADTPRAAAGRAGDAHESAHTLGDLVDARALPVRAVLAEARDRAHHDARVDLPQRLVVDLQPVLHVGAEVLDDDVGLLDEPVEDPPAGVGLQVDRDRPLVAVEVLAVEVREAGVHRALGRADDLDHLGAEVRQHPHGGRAGARVAEVKHLDVGEGTDAGLRAVRARHGQHLLTARVLCGRQTKRSAGGTRIVPRVNRAIELLEQKQPVYYTGSAKRGYEGGKEMAQTWADYIAYDMEHGPFDITELREFMRGLVDGGPTRSGHRTPAVIVTLPIDAINEAVVRANSWVIKQVLASGVHGLMLCHAETPDAVRAFVECCRYPFNTIGVGRGVDVGR